MTHLADTRKPLPMRLKGKAAALTVLAVLWGAAMTAAQEREAADAQDVALAAYRAVYDLELLHASQKTGINAAEGRIVMEITGGPCSGWSSQTRMVVAMHFRRRSSRLSDTHDTGWEAADGSVLRYAAKRYVNGIKSEDYRLEAKRTAPDGPVIVRFSRPARSERELPPGTLFSMQATARMIAAARSGERRVAFPIYEGYEDGEARDVVATIGAAYTAPSAEPGTAALRALPSWPVAMAFYRRQSRRDFGLPEYEVIFRLHANGIVSDVVLNYGDYALKARLVRLELLPVERCDGGSTTHDAPPPLPR